jgi:DNA-binding response OmpR family regulator
LSHSAQLAEEKLTPKLSVLSISGSDGDDRELRRIFGPCHWRLAHASTRADALKMMRKGEFPVVICDRDLSDGTWKDILSESCLEIRPVCLIVTTAVSPDDSLWCEVLNLGGYDVLAKPFEAREVRHSVGTGWQRWRTHNGVPAVSA